VPRDRLIRLQNGIKFTVFEGQSKEDYYEHARDWSMALFWGADYVNNCLPDQLRDRFDEAKSDPFDPAAETRQGTLPFYNGKTGEQVTSIPGGAAVRVSRTKMRKLFSEGMGVEVSLSAENLEVLELSLAVWKESYQLC